MRRLVSRLGASPTVIRASLSSASPPPSRRLIPTLAACLLTAGLLVAPPAQAKVAGTGPGPDPVPSVSRVLVVSLDALNPAAVRRLGRAQTPTLHRLVRRGASTWNARTERELTLTLPNHTGMVTGRRIKAAKGGHGVTWNVHRLRPATVHEAAGERVESVFSTLHAHGLTSSFYAAKQKFSLWSRSWPEAIERAVIAEGRDGAVTRAVRADLAAGPSALTFVHLGAPDRAGHAKGFLTPAYDAAVRATDRRLGRILTTLRETGLADRTLVIVTSDHGGARVGHGDRTLLGNYRIGFLVSGPGVPRGVDLYDLNPAYRDPGERRTGYAAMRQPIRNGDVANLVLDVLGVPAVPGSEHDAAQDLDVYAP